VRPGPSIDGLAQDSSKDAEHGARRIIAHWNLERFLVSSATQFVVELTHGPARRPKTQPVQAQVAAKGAIRHSAGPSCFLAG
jgi:hypothetical protein